MSSPQFLHAPILLLKEGVDTSHRQAQTIANINACQAIVDILKTTLGPRGMDKLIQTENSVTITNDGATIIDLLNIVHPAGRILVDIAKAQDAEIGDGTTSVILLAGELLNEAKQYIEDKVAPQLIIKSFQYACKEALNRLKAVEISIDDKSDSERRHLLEKCAETSLNSKLISSYKKYFAEMIVDAVLSLDISLDKNMIGIKKVTGGSVQDSMLVKGVAFKKTFSYAGFEQQPKSFQNPKILLLNLELELKAEKENAEIRVSNPKDYQSIVDAEWKIIFNKLDLIVNSGAQIVLSRLPIGDLATQYFADHKIFCAGRVEDADMKRTAQATGAKIQTTVNNLSGHVLGTCGKFEEVQLGSERYNFFTDCSFAKTATVILRGGAPQFIDETERSINDAIMIVRRAIKNKYVVGGGGAIEVKKQKSKNKQMELSRYLREKSRMMYTMNSTFMGIFAKALECIPRTLAKNSGLDQISILNQLRQAHNQDNGKRKFNRKLFIEETRWMGVDCNKGICDTYESFIWEPSVVKKNAIEAATEVKKKKKKPFLIGSMFDSFD